MDSVLWLPGLRYYPDSYCPSVGDAVGSTFPRCDIDPQERHLKALHDGGEEQTMGNTQHPRRKSNSRWQKMRSGSLRTRNRNREGRGVGEGNVDVFRERLGPFEPLDLADERRDVVFTPQPGTAPSHGGRVEGVGGETLGECPADLGGNAHDKSESVGSRALPKSPAYPSPASGSAIRIDTIVFGGLSTKESNTTALCKSRRQ